MQEPSLLGWTKRPGNAKAEVYRFLWLCTFHRPVVVRVQKEPDEKIRVFAKMLDGKGGYAPGKLAGERTRGLAKEEWLDLTRRIDDCAFWSMPTEEQHWYYLENGTIENWRIGDGAEWMVEGTRGDDYHVVARTSPDDSNRRKAGKYRELCLHILKLSGLDLDKEQIY